MSKLKNSFHPYAWVTILFWSLAYVFTRLAVSYFSPLALGLLRYLAASAAMLVVAVITKMKRPAGRDVPWLLLSGASGFFLYMIAFNTGSQRVTASTSSVIIATTPVITALLARIFYRERLTVIQYFSVALSFFGVVVLTVLKGGFSVSEGLPWLFAAAILLAVYNLLQKRITKNLSALESTAYSIFFGTVMLCIFLPQAANQVVKARLYKLCTYCL